MNSMKRLIICLFVLCLAVIMVASEPRAEREYIPDWGKWDAAKKFYDDPSPVLKTYGIKQIMPPEEYAKITFDIETMKKKWAEAVGFKSPDVVEKIAPEIKPGKYSYKDKDKYPGLKELMIPAHYERFRPGSPPLGLNFPEMEVVPTQQVWYNLPIAEASIKSKDKVKQDEQGYMIAETYEVGFPFPQPSGKFKAMQIVYNVLDRYTDEQLYAIEYAKTFDRSLKPNFEANIDCVGMRLDGRCTFPPYGFYDARAKERGEMSLLFFKYNSPRDQAGNVIWILRRRGLEDTHQLMSWLALIRRARKMSATDAQDTAPGSNVIFDDYEGFYQKLSPTVYPYKYELLAEREFLVPVFSTDGIEYVSKQGLEYRNVRMERRPMYVVQMTQLDRRYVYGKRILYIDKETFMLRRIENFDQKGRLWRAVENNFAFFPETGMILNFHFLTWNYIDPQTQLAVFCPVQVSWLTREHISLSGMEKKGK